MCSIFEEEISVEFCQQAFYFANCWRERACVCEGDIAIGKMFISRNSKSLQFYSVAATNFFRAFLSAILEFLLSSSVCGHLFLNTSLSFLVLLSRRRYLAAVTLTSSGKYVVISIVTKRCTYFPHSSNKKGFLRSIISDTVVMSWRLRPPILAALLLLLLASLQATDSQEVRNIASRKTLQTCPTETFHLSEI